MLQLIWNLHCSKSRLRGLTWLTLQQWAEYINFKVGHTIVIQVSVVAIIIINTFWFLDMYFFYREFKNLMWMTDFLADTDQQFLEYTHSYNFSILFCKKLKIILESGNLFKIARKLYYLFLNGYIAYID